MEGSSRGNGLATADDIIIKFTNCTAEENARTYKLNKQLMIVSYSYLYPWKNSDRVR